MATENRKNKITNIVPRRQSGLVVILEDITDPHNAAAVFRSCDAFGIQDVRLIFSKQEPFNPKEIGKKSSSSANKWLNFTIYNSPEECFQDLKKSEYSIVATALSMESKPIYTTDLHMPKLAIVFGNEHAGISKYVAENSDLILNIPMQGFVESLNLSVSAGITLYEVTRQRNESGLDFSLSSKEQEELVQDFLTR